MAIVSPSSAAGPAKATTTTGTPSFVVRSGKYLVQNISCYACSKSAYECKLSSQWKRVKLTEENNPEGYGR